jgi:hypothetical protein
MIPPGAAIPRVAWRVWLAMIPLVIWGASLEAMATGCPSGAGIDRVESSVVVAVLGARGVRVISRSSLRDGGAAREGMTLRLGRDGRCELGRRSAALSQRVRARLAALVRASREARSRGLTEHSSGGFFPPPFHPP